MTYISGERGSLLSCNEPIINDSHFVSLKPTSVMGALPYPMKASVEDMIKDDKAKNYVGERKYGLKHMKGEAL